MPGMTLPQPQNSGMFLGQLDATAMRPWLDFNLGTSRSHGDAGDHGPSLYSMIYGDGPAVLPFQGEALHTATSTTFMQALANQGLREIKMETAQDFLGPAWTDHLSNWNPVAQTLSPLFQNHGQADPLFSRSNIMARYLRGDPTVTLETPDIAVAWLDVGDAPDHSRFVTMLRESKTMLFKPLPLIDAAKNKPVPRTEHNPARQYIVLQPIDAIDLTALRQRIAAVQPLHAAARSSAQAAKQPMFDLALDASERAQGATLAQDAVAGSSSSGNSSDDDPGAAQRKVNGKRARPDKPTLQRSHSGLPPRPGAKAGPAVARNPLAPAPNPLQKRGVDAKKAQQNKRQATEKNVKLVRSNSGTSVPSTMSAQHASASPRGGALTSNIFEPYQLQNTSSLPGVEGCAGRRTGFLVHVLRIEEIMVDQWTRGCHEYADDAASASAAGAGPSASAGVGTAEAFRGVVACDIDETLIQRAIAVKSFGNQLYPDPHHMLDRAQAEAAQGDVLRASDTLARWMCANSEHLGAESDLLGPSPSAQNGHASRPFHALQTRYVGDISLLDVLLEILGFKESLDVARDRRAFMCVCKDTNPARWLKNLQPGTIMFAPGTDIMTEIIKNNHVHVFVIVPRRDVDLLVNACNPWQLVPRSRLAAPNYRALFTTSGDSPYANGVIRGLEGLLCEQARVRWSEKTKPAARPAKLAGPRPIVREEQVRAFFSGPVMSMLFDQCFSPRAPVDNPLKDRDDKGMHRALLFGTMPNTMREQPRFEPATTAKDLTQQSCLILDDKPDVWQKEDRGLRITIMAAPVPLYGHLRACMHDTHASRLTVPIYLRALADPEHGMEVPEELMNRCDMSKQPGLVPDRDRVIYATQARSQLKRAADLLQGVYHRRAMLALDQYIWMSELLRWLSADHSVAMRELQRHEHLHNWCMLMLKEQKQGDGERRKLQQRCEAHESALQSKDELIKSLQQQIKALSK